MTKYRMLHQMNQSAAALSHVVGGHGDLLRSARPVASVGASQHRGGGAPARARLRADHRGQRPAHRGCPRHEHDRQLGRVVERGDVQEAVAVDHTDGADACDRGMHRPVVLEQGALAVPVLFDGVITAAAVVAGRRVGPKDRIFALDAAARRLSRALPERPSGGSGDRGARRDR
jgi:hypothetical protein